MGGKLKVISLASLSVLTLTATTIGVASNKSQIQSESYKKIQTEINKVPGLIKNGFSKAMPALTKEYNSATGGLSGRFKSAGDALAKEWNEAHNSTSGIYKYLNENKEEVNFYAFALGNLIKPLIGNIRIVIRDTLVYNKDTKKHQQLLSIQKIIKIASKESFKVFAEKMKKLIKEKINIIEQMTVEDGLGIIKIFREVREDDFDLFMKKVSDNIEQIEKDKNKTYKTAEELLKDVFIGIDECKKSKDKVDTLVNEISKGKGAISDEDMKKIKEILEKLGKELKTE